MTDNECNNHADEHDQDDHASHNVSYDADAYGGGDDDGGPAGVMHRTIEHIGLLSVDGECDVLIFILAQIAAQPFLKSVRQLVVE